ncbi:MAG: replication-relaxation family protein [Saprospiraceae bacterium]
MSRLLRSREEKILRAVSRYKFLTSTQIREITGINRKQNCNPACKTLVERGLLQYVDGERKRDHVYYLMKKGHSFISTNFPDLPWILYSKNRVDYQSDFLFTSRARTRDVIIALEKRLDIKGIEYEAKIDYGQGNLQADAIIHTEKRLWVVEYQHSHKPDHVVKKIANYNKAFHIGNPSKQYGYRGHANVLHVMSEQTTIDNVMNKLRADPAYSPFTNLHGFQLYGSNIVASV